MRRTHVALVLVGLGSLASVPLGLAHAAGDAGVAEAAPAVHAGGDGGDSHDPSNVTGVSRFLEACLRGHARLVAKDHDGAVAAYREAIALAPRNAVGPWLLGEALAAHGDYEKALASFAEAEELGIGRDPRVQARVFFSQADTLERAKKWVDAREAWKKYREFAEKYPDAGAYPNNAESRLQVLGDMLKQDQSYDVVRQRIAAEDAGLLSNKADAAKKK